MFNQGRYPSNSESISSETSDVTSRKTTSSDSWSDTALQQQEQQQQIDRLNIQLNEEDRSSIPLTTIPSENTVDSKKPSMQNTNNNQSNQVTTLNEQQQIWVNPYWDSNGKANVAAAQPGTNKTSNNTNIQYSSPSTQVQQLIPGSILINDQGEIDDSSSKQNQRLDLSTSSNSFNPSGKYISDDSGGSGGYLVPTHIQRQIVTSSPGLNAHPEDHFGYKRLFSSSDADTQNRPEFARQQTFPERTDNNIQPWVNPYWPKSNQTNSQFTQQNNTIENKNSQPSNNSNQTPSTKSYSGTILPEESTSSTNTWENPYWKDSKSQTSTTPHQKDQAWENPYWKDSKSQTSTTPKEEGKSWANPYWKDSKPQTSTTPNQRDQTWENPYWKDSKSQTSTTPKKEGKSWENPYWKDSKSQTSMTPNQKDQAWENPYWKNSKSQTSTTPNQKDQAWENPYWKDSKSQTSTTPKEEGKSWENPYWKDSKPQTSMTPNQKDQAWENPYWKDSKSQTSKVSKQEGKSWENPYWKDKDTSNQYVNGAALKESLSSEYKVPPVPPFYQRIYPSDTAHIKDEIVIYSGTPKQFINDNEDLLYTIDSQRIAHYRAAASSPSGINKTANFASAPKTSQYPVLSLHPPSPPLTAQTSNAASPPYPRSAPPTAQTSNAVSPPYPPTAPPTLQAPNAALLSQTTSSASPLFSNLDNYPLSSFNYSSLTSSSPIILTEEEVNNIQHALHLLATNPDAIPIIETSNQVPSSNISHHNNLSSPLASLSTVNQQQQFQQQPPPTSSPLASLSTVNQQQQFHQQPPPSSSTVNQQQKPPSSAFPFASLSTTNQQQQSQQQPPPSSAPFTSFLNANQQQQSQPPPPPSSAFPLASLSTTNQQQPPPSSAPFASLSTANQQQQSKQEPPSSAFPLASLSTVNQQQQSQQQPSEQQPPPSSSPLASFLTANRQQQPHQQSLPPSSSLFSENVQLNSAPHAYDSNSQKSSLFSTPSYPSDLDETLQQLIRKGSIVLI